MYKGVYKYKLLPLLPVTKRQQGYTLRAYKLNWAQGQGNLTPDSF